MISIDAYGALKDLLSYIKENKKHDPQLHELVNMVWTDVNSMREECIVLREKVEKYEQRLKDKGEMEWDQRCGIWRKKGEEGQGGFCPKCWGEKKRQQPLQVEEMGWRCNVCGQFIGSPDAEDGGASHYVDFGDD